MRLSNGWMIMCNATQIIMQCELSTTVVMAMMKGNDSLGAGASDSPLVNLSKCLVGV